MNDDSILGSTLGQLGQAVKQTAKQVVKIPQEMAQDVGKQMTSNADEKTPPQGQEPEGQKEQKPSFQNDEERKAFLKSLYGPSESSTPKDSNSNQQKPHFVRLRRTSKGQRMKNLKSRLLIKLRRNSKNFERFESNCMISIISSW